MGGAGGHVEGRRGEDPPGAPQGHQAAQLLKPHIEADAKAHGPPGGVEGGDLPARGQDLRLHEPLAALHVDVEQVDLPVPGDAGAVGSIDKGGVVYPVPLQLRQGPGDQIDAPLPGQLGHGPLGGPGKGLAVIPEACVVIGAAEHFRQHRQVDVPGGAHQFAGMADVLRLIGGNVHLDLCDFHKDPPYTKTC